MNLTGTVDLPEGVLDPGNLAFNVKVTVTICRFIDAEERLDQILSKIEIPNKEDIRENITLPLEMDGISLTWKSSDETVISARDRANANYYTTPAGVVSRKATDQKVVLTVSASDGGITRARDIEVTVKAKPQKEN